MTKQFNRSTPTGQTRRSSLVRAAVAIAAVAATVVATGCSPAADTSGQTTIRYWMWDSNQLPGYRQCADDFQKLNPDINIEIEQYGWEDYWTQLTASMVAESAPDVFVDHTSQFGKFASLGQILDISDYLEQSEIDPAQFQDGLTDLWTGPDGKAVYGLPKDWDTEAIFYNTEMVEAAGYSARRPVGAGVESGGRGLLRGVPGRHDHRREVSGATSRASTPAT